MTIIERENAKIIRAAKAMYLCYQNELMVVTTAQTTTPSWESATQGFRMSFCDMALAAFKEFEK